MLASKVNELAAEIRQELSEIRMKSLLSPQYDGRRRARELMLETLLHGILQEEKPTAAGQGVPPSFYATPKASGASQVAKASTRGAKKFLPGSEKPPLENGRMKR